MTQTFFEYNCTTQASSEQKSMDMKSVYVHTQMTDLFVCVVFLTV